MKPSKTLSRRNQGHLALWGPICYSTSCWSVLSPHEMLRASSLKEEEPGSNTILGAFSCISPWRDIRLPFFLLDDLAPTDSLTHSFPCLCTVSTFLQRSDGYSSTQSLPTLPPRGGNAPLYKLSSLYWSLSIYMFVSDNTAAATHPANGYWQDECKTPGLTLIGQLCLLNSSYYTYCRIVVLL